MGLDGIQNLSQLNAVLKNTLDRVNAGDQTPLEVGYASRKFKIDIDGNGFFTKVKMEDIINRFKKLAEKENSDKSLIGDIHDRIVLLDLQGDIALENKGVLSVFLRNVLNPRLSSHLDAIDAIQKQYVFNKLVIGEAKRIKIDHEYQTSNSYTRGIVDRSFIGDKEFEIAKSALRYLALTKPQLAHKIIKDLNSYLETTEKLNPNYVKSLKDLIHHLDIELSVRPEYRNTTVEHGEKTQTLIDAKAIRNLYEKHQEDPKTFKEEFLKPSFLHDDDTRIKALKRLFEKHPKVTNSIFDALIRLPKEPTDEEIGISNFYKKILHSIEEKAIETKMKELQKLAEYPPETAIPILQPYITLPENPTRIERGISTRCRDLLRNIELKQAAAKIKTVEDLVKTHPKVAYTTIETHYAQLPENATEAQKKIHAESIKILSRMEQKKLSPSIPRPIKVENPETLDKALGYLMKSGPCKINLNKHNLPQLVFSGTTEKLTEIKEQIENTYNFIPATLKTNMTMTTKTTQPTDSELVIENNLLTYLLAPQDQHDQMNALMYKHLFDSAHENKELKQQIILGAIRNLGDNELKIFFKLTKITQTDLAEFSDETLKVLASEKPQVLKDTALWQYLEIEKLKASDKINLFRTLIKNAIMMDSSSIIFNTSYNKFKKIKFNKSVYDDIKELLGDSGFSTTFKGEELFLDYDIAVQLLIPIPYTDTDQMNKIIYLKALKQNPHEKSYIVSGAIANLKSDDALLSFFKDSKIKVSSLNTTLKQELETRKISGNSNKSMWDVLSEMEISGAIKNLQSLPNESSPIKAEELKPQIPVEELKPKSIQDSLDETKRLIKEAISAESFSIIIVSESEEPKIMFRKSELAESIKKELDNLGTHTGFAITEFGGHLLLEHDLAAKFLTIDPFENQNAMNKWMYLQAFKQPGNSKDDQNRIILGAIAHISNDRGELKKFIEEADIDPSTLSTDLKNELKIRKIPLTSQ